MFSASTTFGCRALDGPALDGSEPIQLSRALAVHPKPPVELDSTWQKWLGTIQAEQFSKSRFVIVVQLHNPSFQVNNREQVDSLIQAFHCALLLQGYGYCSGGLEVGGNTDAGLHVGPIGSLFSYLPSPNRHLNNASTEALHEAYRLAQSIIYVFGHHRRFMRLRRSFGAWLRGIREGDVIGDRLHNFVRVAEGLTQPPRRGLTNSFVSRCQLFVGNGVRNAKLLRQLYNIRSCMEHIQHWRSDLTKIRELNTDESFLFRALQAELLASSTLTRILGSRKLLRHFATEATIRRFWSLDDPDRQALWGAPFCLNQEANRCYIRLQ